MVKQSRAALLPTNLPHLQNLIKRDAGSYKEEFLLQWQHYQSSYSIFLLRPDEEGQRFVELAGFIAQVFFTIISLTKVANYYSDYTVQFPEQLAQLLFEHHASLSPEVREKLVQSLVILRKKGVITATRYYNAIPKLT